jgi:hypothetical protein
MTVAFYGSKAAYGICPESVIEPISRLRNKVMKGTWVLYGFETAIWGARPHL